jgi:hypothetical protein
MAKAAIMAVRLETIAVYSECLNTWAVKTTSFQNLL